MSTLLMNIKYQLSSGVSDDQKITLTLGFAKHVSGLTLRVLTLTPDELNIGDVT